MWERPKDLLVETRAKTKASLLLLELRIRKKKIVSNRKQERKRKV